MKLSIFVVYTILMLNQQVLQLHVGPSHVVIKLLKVIRLSADFSFSRKQFKICGPKDMRMSVPKVT